MSQVGGFVDDDLKLIAVHAISPLGNLALDEYLPIGSLDSRVRERVGGFKCKASHCVKQSGYQQHKRQYLNRGFLQVHILLNFYLGY